ncbi:MAG: hypothetical protein HN712_18550 [Gemmatimonadetes bacterium]|jgi:hypothetical protein|nr:hypothetical protein [Gemmatimonadota bacterium]MBT7862326.1 hypothetical protein [Gemmatimonadota bacterium]
MTGTPNTVSPFDFSTPVTARRREEFLLLWNETRNFLLGRELIHFDLDFPSAEEIVDILRQHGDTKLSSNQLEDDAAEADLVDKLRNAPLEQVMDLPFNIATFELHNFYGPGQFLEEFQQRVMIPWRTFLSAAGLTWQRCYPIIFISGKGCSSQFHADNSHVMAWQIHGTKAFHGFQDPSKYGPIQRIVDERNQYRSRLPPEHDPADLLSYFMEPGDMLWNQLLTPHWVDGGNDDIAVSVNISHGGIQHAGQFCPNEQVLRRRWEDHPEEAWLVDQRY